MRRADGEIHLSGIFARIGALGHEGKGKLCRFFLHAEIRCENVRADCNFPPVLRDGIEQLVFAVVQAECIVLLAGAGECDTDRIAVRQTEVFCCDDRRFTEVDGWRDGDSIFWCDVGG